MLKKPIVKASQNNRYVHLKRGKAQLGGPFNCELDLATQRRISPNQDNGSQLRHARSNSPVCSGACAGGAPAKALTRSEYKKYGLGLDDLPGPNQLKRKR